MISINISKEDYKKNTQAIQKGFHKYSVQEIKTPQSNNHAAN